MFVTSDHGEEFGEHGSTRHGKTLYQELLHIPGILKLPGSAHAGRRVDAVASNIDVAPTLLELAGAEIPAAFQGRSLVSLIRGDTAVSARPVFAEVVAPKFVADSARDERFKCVRTLAPSVEDMLFDLAERPSETHNLAGEPPLQARALVSELERFLMHGQHGYHLALLGPRPGARVRAEVTAAAVFDGAYRFGIETGDVMETRPDRRRVALEFIADGRPRHLVLQTKPEGAPVSLEVYVDRVPLGASGIRVGSWGCASRNHAPWTGSARWSRSRTPPDCSPTRARPCGSGTCLSSKGAASSWTRRRSRRCARSDTCSE